jgi:hypothetical protein
MPRLRWKPGFIMRLWGTVRRGGCPYCKVEATFSRLASLL